VGTSADFVMYDADPREDLAVLSRPTCIVLRGAVVG
jgi:imidazolonepropionase-like amidohydrolase